MKTYARAERRSERERKGKTKSQTRARDSGVHPTFKAPGSDDRALLTVVAHNPESSALVRSLLGAIRDALRVELGPLQPRLEPALLARFDVDAELCDLGEHTARLESDVAKADEGEADAEAARAADDRDPNEPSVAETLPERALRGQRDRVAGEPDQKDAQREAEAAAREAQVILPTRVRGPEWSTPGVLPSEARLQGAIVFELDPKLEFRRRTPGDTPPGAADPGPRNDAERLDEAVPSDGADATATEAEAKADARATDEQQRAEEKAKQDEERAKQEQKNKQKAAAAQKAMAKGKEGGTETEPGPLEAEPAPPEADAQQMEALEVTGGSEPGTEEDTVSVAPEQEGHEVFADPAEPPPPVGDHLPPVAGAGVGASGELEAWKSAANAATAALPMPNIGPASARTGGMSGQAEAVTEAGEAQRKALPAQAEEIFNAKPRDISQLSDIAQEVLESDPTGKVQIVKNSARRAGLPPQTLPNLRPTPDGNVPNLFGDPITPARFNQLRKEYGLSESPHAPDASQIEELAHKMANDVELEGRVAGFAGQVVEGAVLPPKPEVAPARQADFAAVLARIMTGSAEVAQATIDGARDATYPHQALTRAFAKLGNEWVSDEETFIHGEMQRVADAAGISGEQLNAAVAQRQKELAEKVGSTRAEGEKVYADARETISADFEKRHAQIEGLRQEWEEKADALAASMKGNVDAKKVRARQRELETAVSEFAADWIVAYDDMGKERAKKLREAAQQQQRAYSAAIKLDIANDVAEAEAEGDTEKAEAIRTDKDKIYSTWITESMKPVYELIGGYVKTNTETVSAWQTEMRQRRDEALKELRDWGDQQIGRERGFFDMILDWIFGWEQAEKEEAKAFAKQRASETTVAMGASFQALDTARTNFGEELDDAERAQLKSLNEEQRAVVEAYYSKEGAGDSIGAVAAGLKVRLKKQRSAEVAKSMQREVLAKPTNDAESARGLPILADAGFGVEVRPIVTDCHAGFEHTWGTDESKIWGALGKVTSVEVGMAVRADYWKTYNGEDFYTRLKSELAGGMFDDEEDYDRAKAQLEANPVDAMAAELRIAVEGLGTEEEDIKGVLRRLQKPGEKAPKMEDVIAAYKRMYGEDLSDRLKSEMSGVDLDVNMALYEQNEEKADAIELKDAQWTWTGPSQKGIESVYDRVQKEEWERGKAAGKSLKEIDDAITARLAKMSSEYTDYTKGAKLEEDYQKLPENLKDLALGLQAQKWDEVDAARLQIEREGLGAGVDQYGQRYQSPRSVYADDEVINGKILAAQYDRAYQRREWEAELEVRKLEKEWNETHDTPWSPAERRARLDKAKEEASLLAQDDAAKSMTKFKATFMHTYEPGRPVSDFDTIIYDLTQGVGEEEARARLRDPGGYLPPDMQVEFALKNDEPDAVKAQLKGKTRAQIQKIREDWERAHPGQSFDKRVLGELSGRDRNDVGIMLKYGEPTNPTEALEVARAMADYEARTGGVRTYRDLQGNLVQSTRHEYQQIQAQIKDLEADEAAWKAAQLEYPTQKVWDEKLGWVETQSADAAQYESAWQTTFGGVRSLVETHRAVVDAETDLVANIVAMVVAVTLAAVLAPFTAGASLAIIALVAAGVAAASTVAMMAVKYSMKGDAYSKDEFMMDLAFGVVDVAVSAVTAGVGGKLMRAAMAAKLAAKTGTKEVAESTVRQALKQAGKQTAKQTTASVAHETLQGLAGTLLVPAVMDEYGRDLNPVLGMIVGMGLGMGSGIAVSKGIGAMGKALPRRPARMPQTLDLDLADVRYNREKFGAMQEAYLEANPGRNADDFVRDYDELLLKQMKDEKVRAKWQEQARNDMLQHVPEGQKTQFATTPIEMMSDQDFKRLTGSRKKGEAVVIMKDGKPSIIVRQGASPTALRREAAHLLQAVDDLGAKQPGRLEGKDLRAKLKSVSEENLADWHNKDVRERFKRYGDKLDVEIDAAHRDLEMLKAAKRKANPDPSIADELAEVEAVLEGLAKRRTEIANIGPLRRTLMAWGGTFFAPKYLDHPPRLFHKKGTKGSKAKPKPKPKPKGSQADPENASIGQVDSTAASTSKPSTPAVPGTSAADVGVAPPAPTPNAVGLKGRPAIDTGQTTPIGNKVLFDIQSERTYQINAAGSPQPYPLMSGRLPFGTDKTPTHRANKPVSVDQPTGQITNPQPQLSASTPVKTKDGAERPAREVLRDANDPSRPDAERNKSKEYLGDAAAQKFAEDNYPGSPQDGFEGPNTVDRVIYNANPPPKVIVVEAKGGEGKNTSSRQAGDDRYEQGTPEYLQHVAEQMAKSDDAAKRRAGNAILKGLRERPPSVQYTKVIQPTEPLGKHGEPPAARVEEFTGTRESGNTIPTAKDFAARPRATAEPEKPKAAKKPAVAKKPKGSQ